ncbi:MAG: 4-alpha-glucanotransferase [Sphingobacteriales bacterium]|nr:4-alpha-glucanotransferase [Sphingobacteriales bacterium]
MILHFYIRYSTKAGQNLFLSGTGEALGDFNSNKAIPLQYLDHEFWYGQVEIGKKETGTIQYKYILREEPGTEFIEWGEDRIIELKTIKSEQLILIDTWNHAGSVENPFYTKPFQDVLLPSRLNAKPKAVKGFSHEFRVKSPLLNKDEVLCIIGNINALGNWDTANPQLLTKSGNWWIAKVDLKNENFPLSYKYGIYNSKVNSFVAFEQGDNRLLRGDDYANKLTIVHDGFTRFGTPAWKGAGVAIPVFSLRSKNGLGTGEFTDIKLLVDWAKSSGLKMIQLLPVNDTTATHTWTDCYPYAAISAFALHPLYLNLDKVAGKKNAAILKPFKLKQKELNALPVLDYEQVINIKLAAISELYTIQKDTIEKDEFYQQFIVQNQDWLIPYAAFSYLRDKYKTADFTKWKTNGKYEPKAIQKLVAPFEKQYDEIAIYYFTQYHLHLQLKEATAYAHKNGIIVKGDLPIGIYRYSADAWMAPELYHMDAQAGAPPDAFAIKGQNWGFPIYNWEKMQADGFAWWRQRFQQMSHYFDAFRIDHILGFFRIWSIPLNAVEGIMGRFVPAIPVHITEIHQKGISFEPYRYCKPYITDHVIEEVFGEKAGYVKANFLVLINDSYELKSEFDTQRKVETYFGNQKATDENQAIKIGLYDLISNVILFEEEGNMHHYHLPCGAYFNCRIF